MPDFGNADSVMDLFGDLFGGVFGGAGKGKGRRGSQAGNDFHLGIEIDLIDAMKGVEKKVKIPRDVTCKACSGNGCKPGSTPVRCKRCDGKGVVIQGNGFFRIQQTCSGCGGKGATITSPCTSCRGAGLIQEHEELVLNIPPGVDDGVNIRHTGSGEASRNGGPPGDLYVQIKVKKHSFSCAMAQIYIVKCLLLLARRHWVAKLKFHLLTEKRSNLNCLQGYRVVKKRRYLAKGCPH